MLLNCGVGKTLGSSLDSKEIQLVNSKGNQSWIYFGRTDVEVEAPIVWPPDAKSWLMRKTLMLGKIEGKRRRGLQNIVGWHHGLDGHEFEQALGAVDGQWSLACCSQWGHKELDTTARVNWTDWSKVYEEFKQQQKNTKKVQTTHLKNGQWVYIDMILGRRLIDSQEAHEKMLYIIIAAAAAAKSL